VKNLRVKKSKLGKVRTIRKPYAFLRNPIVLALIIALVAAGAIGLAPYIFRFPVAISLNGEEITVPFGTKVGEVAAEHIDPDYLYGILFAVDETILDEHGGGRPIFIADGESIEADTPIRRQEVIIVNRGADQTETIVEETIEIAPEQTLRRTGTGSLRQLIPAEPGIKIRSYGEVSGIEVKVEEISEPQRGEIRFSALPSNGTRKIALTFDDGPHPEYTPALLRVLEREEVSATFFLLGREVTAHPEIARQIVEAGHQVANHSYNHPDYRRLDNAEKHEDFLRAQDVIEEATGVRPNWVRPPYGAMDESAELFWLEEGMKIALWSIDPVDWQRPGVDAITDEVVSSVHPGAIPVLHDAGGDRSQTVRATRNIIRELRDMDYTFVTIEELYDYINQD